MVIEWKGQKFDDGERRRLVNGSMILDTKYSEMKQYSSAHFRNYVFAKNYITCMKPYGLQVDSRSRNFGVPFLSPVPTCKKTCREFASPLHSPVTCPLSL